MESICSECRPIGGKHSGEWKLLFITECVMCIHQGCSDDVLTEFTFQLAAVWNTTVIWTNRQVNPSSIVAILHNYGTRTSPIARFIGPTWGPSGADRTRVGPMLAPWTLLSGLVILPADCLAPSDTSLQLEYCTWYTKTWNTKKK